MKRVDGIARRHVRWLVKHGGEVLHNEWRWAKDDADDELEAERVKAWPCHAKYVEQPDAFMDDVEHRLVRIVQDLALVRQPPPVQAWKYKKQCEK